jgi:hypothetical protein
MRYAGRTIPDGWVSPASRAVAVFGFAVPREYLPRVLTT